MGERKGKLRLGFSACMALAASAADVHALQIELKGEAADRIERQRAAATGALPLPGTPNIANFKDRLKEQGVRLSSPVLIRVFKAESELEIWKEKDGAFVLFASYPVCHWSGTLGPKLQTGDKQAPEGFYTLTRAQTRHSGRWPKSLNIGFPNLFDQSQARTGSDILIHGGCTSVGCFAMTNAVMEEIYQITVDAIDGGQQHVPVYVLPFRMTDYAMQKRAQSPWMPFWSNLKEGNDAFEKDKRPSVVSVCDGKYKFAPAPAGRSSGPVEACTPTLAGIKEQDQWLSDVPRPSSAPILPRADIEFPGSATATPPDASRPQASSSGAPPPL